MVPLANLVLVVMIGLGVSPCVQAAPSRVMRMVMTPRATILQSSSRAEAGTSTSLACLAQSARWNGEKVLGSDGENECHWSKIREGSTPFLNGGTAPSMCTRAYYDLVSDWVYKYGRWDDCPPLASWWEYLPDRSSEAEFGNINQCHDQEDVTQRSRLYVDIGANIGSCLMPMVARPDVEAAFAFEPAPQNLFYLTSSILANPQVKTKVMLYPIALGSEDETESIYSEQGNAGNTVVGEAVHTGSHPVGNVNIVKLDQVFKEGAMPPYIHLMKIDAQGFEVKIMKGAKKLFASGAVNAVKFELATEWLAKQGTPPVEYMNFYLSHGFQIYNTGSKQLLAQETLHAKACGGPIIEDFVAVRIKKGEVAAQKPIAC